MRLTIVLMLIMLAFAGCTDDTPETDDHGDGCEDAADHDACHEAMDEGSDGMEMMPRQVVEVTISWDGTYNVDGAYSQDTITVPANATVELTFTNNDPLFGHDFVVEGIEGAATAVLGAGGSSETITFDVGAPMSVKFFCSIQGHRANGMEGDFVVE